MRLKVAEPHNTRSLTDRREAFWTLLCCDTGTAEGEGRLRPWSKSDIDHVNFRGSSKRLRHTWIPFPYARQRFWHIREMVCSYVTRRKPGMRYDWEYQLKKTSETSRYIVVILEYSVPWIHRWYRKLCLLSEIFGNDITQTSCSCWLVECVLGMSGNDWLLMLWERENGYSSTHAECRYLSIMSFTKLLIAQQPSTSRRWAAAINEDVDWDIG
jgi:hypothetical protein